MLNSIFTIFLFQLVGEFIQKFFEISIPGPVIGLILLLTVLLIKNKYSNAPTNLENDLMRSCQSLINYLPLLFIPVGVGVVMLFISFRRKFNFSYFHHNFRNFAYSCLNWVYNGKTFKRK